MHTTNSLLLVHHYAINHNVPPHPPTGTLNGLITTFGSLGNALGPICGSIAYASFVDWPTPLDGRLVFFAGAGIIFALGCVAGRFLVDE